MTLSKQVDRAAVSREPGGRSAGTLRVLGNAVLILLAFEIVSMAAAAACKPDLATMSALCGTGLVCAGVPD